MTLIRDQIHQALNPAMKARDKTRVSTLRLLIAALQKVLTDRAGRVGKAAGSREAFLADIDKDLTDQETLKVLATEAKRRREAAEAFRKGGKEDMALMEEAELVIIQEYLPAQLTEEEVREMATKAISEIAPSSKREMGKVMGKIMPQLKGKFDGKKAGQIVREAFAAYWHDI